MLNKAEQVLGIRFYGERKFLKREVLAEDTNNPKWYDVEGTYENFKEIPEGMEIIGVRCSRNTCEEEIPKIAFILWEPRKDLYVFD